jgi:hypothetical protein
MSGDAGKWTRSQVVASANDTGALEVAATRTACTFAVNACIADASIDASRVCTACATTGDTNWWGVNMVRMCAAPSSDLTGWLKCRITIGGAS